MAESNNTVTVNTSPQAKARRSRRRLDSEPMSPTSSAPRQFHPQGSNWPAKARPKTYSLSERKNHLKNFLHKDKKENKPHLSEGQSSFEYFDDDYMELEEPFSSSEDDDDSPSARRNRKGPRLQLPAPRHRIRTLSGTVPPVGFAPVWGGPTMCLNCYEFFDLPIQTDEYVKHLMDKHRILIADIESIVDLKRYVEHWRPTLTGADGEKKIGEIFPEIKPTEDDPLYGKVDKYYLMSDTVGDDWNIRRRLALRRLEEVLHDQQRERDDRTFNRSCLFCRYRVKGNRAKLIHHLYTIHHLNLGSPDNLVFVNEYLDLLQRKLDNNQCLYCEKYFNDHNLLMEHMRKRAHREVNPNNNYYDKFYVINYLELGKKWLDVLGEDFEDNTPAFLDSDDEDEETTWDEWQEDNIEENNLFMMCLFCEETTYEYDNLLAHMKEKHDYDLKATMVKHKFDFYQQAKFVNYIRKMSYHRICFVCGKNDLGSWEALRKHLFENDHLNKLPEEERWMMTEEFLVPTFENDYLLTMLDSSELDSVETAFGAISMDPSAAQGDASSVATVAVEDKENVMPEGAKESKSCAGPQVTVFPEDMPEFGDYLKDPASREELM